MCLLPVNWLPSRLQRRGHVEGQALSAGASVSSVCAQISSSAFLLYLQSRETQILISSPQRLVNVSLGCCGLVNIINEAVHTHSLLCQRKSGYNQEDSSKRTCLRHLIVLPLSFFLTSFRPSPPPFLASFLFFLITDSFLFLFYVYPLFI